MATLPVDRIESKPDTQKSKLRQAVEDSTAALVAQLNAGKSEALTNYFRTMAQFRNYSFGNQLLIAWQRPDASRVAGFQKWLELKRYVRKGEKGIAILAPVIVKGPRDKSADGTSESGPRLMGFKVVYVFDVSQTDGEPLPEFDLTVKGDAGPLTVRLVEHIRANGTPVDWDESIAPNYGLCTLNGIKILPGQSSALEFATLVHEYAHRLLHQGERRSQTTKTIRETEAEAVSFIVATACGMDYDRTASDYIQMYNGDAATLLESLQHVQGAATEILTALAI